MTTAPRSYFDGAQHERTLSSDTGYGRVSSGERGWIHASAHLRQGERNAPTRGEGLAAADVGAAGAGY